MSRQVTMIGAICEAIDEEMGRDENVIVLGEDVGEMGGPWGSVRGLQAKYGKNRIYSTPISEWGFTGIAVGAAMEATSDEIIATIHSHPTVTEALREAVLSAEGRSIHMPPARR